MLLIFGALGALMTVPLLSTLAHVSAPLEAGLLVLAALAVISCYTSISGLVKAELFPGEVRALGVGLPYAVANALFGGTAEYVGLWFKSRGIESGFFWYVTGFFILALISAWFLPETRIESHLAREHGGVGTRAEGSAALP
jgi:MHS family alpha-ketoglutarate permease-like MFS transporter